MASLLFLRLGENAITKKITEEEERKQLKEQETTWYHEGPQALRDGRFWIADYSLPRYFLILYLHIIINDNK